MERLIAIPIELGIYTAAVVALKILESSPLTIDDLRFEQWQD